MTSDDTARALYREFDPGPPEPEHLDEIYVDLDEVRGGVSVTAALAGEIALSEGHVCRLFTGHRGCGKTTELLRLKRLLEEDAAHSVVVVPSEHLLDLNDVDFPDLLIAIVRELAEQLHARFGIELKPAYLTDRLDRIRHLLVSPIELDKVGLSSGFLKLGMQMKQSPEARREIRAALEPDTSNLIAAVNDLLGDVSAKLRAKGLGPLVLVIDDIDKISMRMHDSGVPMGEYLFVGRYPQMSGLDCHVVYTIPLALAYSISGAQVAGRYGGQLQVLPMIEIATRPPERKDHEPGLERMRRIVARRLESAGVKTSLAFSQGSVDQLIRASGGQPRELMHLVRRAVVAGGVPVTLDEGVRVATVEARRALRLGLSVAHEKVLNAVRESGELDRTAENEPVIRELLESRMLLYYINDEGWYAPNPLLQPA